MDQQQGVDFKGVLNIRIPRYLFPEWKIFVQDAKDLGVSVSTLARARMFDIPVITPTGEELEPWFDDDEEDEENSSHA